MSLGIDWTPTLLIVGIDGLITDVMVGELSQREEELFMARLTGDPDAGILNNLPVVTIISDGEFRNIDVDTWPHVVDVRDRKPHRRDGRAAAVNIPADELGTRALIELATTRPVFVDCSVEIPYRECRYAAYVLAYDGFSPVAMIVP